MPGKTMDPGKIYTITFANYSIKDISIYDDYLNFVKCKFTGIFESKNAFLQIYIPTVLIHPWIHPNVNIIYASTPMLRFTSRLTKMDIQRLLRS